MFFNCSTFTPKPSAEGSIPSAPAIVVTDYVSFATTFSLKSHRLAHAVAPPIPKKSLTFRGPHKFAAQPCGFEPFFLLFKLGTRSVLPHFEVQNGCGFPIRRHTLTTIPSVTSSIKHQNFRSD